MALVNSFSLFNALSRIWLFNAAISVSFSLRSSAVGEKRLILTNPLIYIQLIIFSAIIGSVPPSAGSSTPWSSNLFTASSAAAIAGRWFSRSSNKIWNICWYIIIHNGWGWLWIKRYGMHAYSWHRVRTVLQSLTLFCLISSRSLSGLAAIGSAVTRSLFSWARSPKTWSKESDTSCVILLLAAVSSLAFSRAWAFSFSYCPLYFNSFAWISPASSSQHSSISSKPVEFKSSRKGLWSSIFCWVSLKTKCWD